MFPIEKVPMERQQLEFDCLKLLHSIQPGSVPEAYCLDRNHNASMYNNQVQEAITLILVGNTFFLVSQLSTITRL